MTTEEFQRKLTAILSADVQGYSRLMGEDEDNTIRTLTAYRALMSNLIQKHRGHVVDTPGDNLLADFNSVMDAVRCAVEIQEELRIRNADFPENRKMQFRIGINLGDIVEDGDHIYGDGINIAARVEGMAEGGGICISGTVYDAIRNKLSMSYEFMGEHVVKNIKELVRIYKIKVEPEDESAKQKEKKVGLRKWQWAAVSVAAILILGAVAIWYFDLRVEEGPKTIAVLPFVNMSSDPEQEYFVDGLSEELLNSLAQIPDLTVIARTSAFSFKGTTKKVQEIASELGVDNLLEGSVRKSGDSLRITAQLVKGVDGSHLWSKTYDRELKDIFEVQEDIAKSVADELKATLGIGESLKLLGGTDNEKAYELYLIAYGQVWRMDHSVYHSALELINSAITLDHEFALAWALKADIHHSLADFGLADNAITEFDAGYSAVLKAIEIEPNLAEAYAALGNLKSSKGELLEAGFAYRRAAELTTRPLYYLAGYMPHLMAVGYIERPLELTELAWRSDPLNQIIRIHELEVFGLLGDLQRAEEIFESVKANYGLNNLSKEFITMARLGSGHVLSSDDILDSAPIHGTVKKHLNSPKEGLVELRLFYSDKDYQDAMSLSSISLWAAYFHDPEFAMDAIEKIADIDVNLIALLKACWNPVMKEVRQTNRFKELVKEIGIVDYWNEFGWPDICHQLDNGDFECD